MKIILYILLAIIVVVLLIVVIGLILPKTRTLTKQTIYNASVEKVYNMVTNNVDWKYRTSLDDLVIVETNGDIEVWDEITGGNIIRFKTCEKKPYSFYSFDMEGKLFKGYWFAEFKSADNGGTLFIATESIEYKNPFIRTLAYLFMDLDKFMEAYQQELRIKIENN